MERTEENFTEFDIARENGCWIDDDGNWIPLDDDWIPLDDDDYDWYEEE